METMKTPGVYVVEKKSFPNSVVEVATAVPAFIGYTQKAEKGAQSLSNVPFRISSMLEYEKYFGGVFSKDKLRYNLSLVDDNADVKKKMEAIATEENEEKKKELKHELENLKKSLTDLLLCEIGYSLKSTGSPYTFYEHINLFFANGGGNCYIVSVGNYDTPISKDSIEKGIMTIEREHEPTMLVVPEAVNISECYDVYKKMLQHCGKMKNQFAILDVYEGYKSTGDVINNFRAGVGSEYLGFGAAYYPWLNSSSLSLDNIGREILSNNNESLLSLIYFTIPKQSDNHISHDVRRFELAYECNLITNSNSNTQDDDIKAVKKRIGMEDPITIAKAKGVVGGGTGWEEKILDVVDQTLPVLLQTEMEPLVNKWWKESNEADKIIAFIKERITPLPPSAAMAGIYAAVDNTRGVWKAPANVSLNSVISPTVDITDEEQKGLNVSLDGKSVNAIRSFTGSGIKVWGARTLAGSDLNLCYINVRRTMIFLEESVKNAARSYVFEPNDANTWLNMKCMIENFLRGVWKRGGLVGSSPEEAFSVHIGLGETMTPEDILEGIMRISVMVAISHPAEFIEITFQQQMQKS